MHILQSIPSETRDRIEMGADRNCVLQLCSIGLETIQDPILPSGSVRAARDFQDGRDIRDTGLQATPPPPPPPDSGNRCGIQRYRK